MTEFKAVRRWGGKREGAGRPLGSRNVPTPEGLLRSCLKVYGSMGREAWLRRLAESQPAAFADLLVCLLNNAQNAPREAKEAPRGVEVPKEARTPAPEPPEPVRPLPPKPGIGQTVALVRKRLEEDRQSRQVVTLPGQAPEAIKRGAEEAPTLHMRFPAESIHQYDPMEKWR